MLVVVKFVHKRGYINPVPEPDAVRIAARVADLVVRVFFVIPFKPFFVKFLAEVIRLAGSQLALLFFYVLGKFKDIHNVVFAQVVLDTVGNYLVSVLVDSVVGFAVVRISRPRHAAGRIRLFIIVVVFSSVSVAAA